MEVEQLRERVDYDPATGVFTSKVKTNVWQVGKVLGSLTQDGYLSVMLDGKNYMLHRLAFLFMEGSMPPELVDHINCIRDDNRWENLRHADWELNTRNTLISKNNTSGVIGVSWHKKSGKWQAFVSQDSKPVYLGLFASLEEAIAAREAAKVSHNYPRRP